MLNDSKYGPRDLESLFNATNLIKYAIIIHLHQHHKRLVHL